MEIDGVYPLQEAVQIPRPPYIMVKPVNGPLKQCAFAEAHESPSRGRGHMTGLNRK